MFTKIEVDGEVFAALKERAEPFVDTTPNDVLRRLLLTNDVDPIDDPSSVDLRARAPKQLVTKRRPGALMRLLNEGLIEEGDQCTHERKRSGETYHVKVTRDGWVEAPDGTTFIAPSPALKAFVGTEIDGWAFWRHDRSGSTLKQLRSQLAS